MDAATHVAAMSSLAEECKQPSGTVRSVVPSLSLPMRAYLLEGYDVLVLQHAVIQDFPHDVVLHLREHQVSKFQ